jgi:PKD repeat protein/lysophospholipase L1-like esterase
MGGRGRFRAHPKTRGWAWRLWSRRWRLLRNPASVLVVSLLVGGLLARAIATAAPNHKTSQRPRRAIDIGREGSRSRSVTPRHSSRHRPLLCSSALRRASAQHVPRKLSAYCNHTLGRDSPHGRARAHVRPRHGSSRAPFVAPALKTTPAAAGTPAGAPKHTKSAPKQICPPTATTSGCVNRTLANLLPALAPVGTAQIKGTVTTAATSEPVESIEVCAYNEAAFECVFTGPGGEYDITGLPAGSYTVFFGVPFETNANYVTQYYNDKRTAAEATPVVVSAGGTAGGINAALHAGGQITGKVTDASTKAEIGGIEVCARRETEEEFTVRCAQTNSTGEYDVVGLPTGQYKVEFSVPFETALNYMRQYYNGKPSLGEADPVSVAMGSTTSGINAAMHEGGRITGTVTDASTNAAVAKIQVCAYGGLEGTYRCASTNSTGEYNIGSLQTGEYRVAFAPPFEGNLNYIRQYYNNKNASFEAEPILVKVGGTTPNINAAMQPGGQVAGKVTDAGTKAALAEIEVCASQNSGEFFQRCVFTNASGEYTISGLPTANYTVFFFSFSGPYASQYYNNKVALNEAQAVSVTTGTLTSGIDAAMQLGAEITGKVTDASTKASLRGIEVCATAASANSSINCTTTDQAGDYMLSRLPAAEYRIEFFPTFISSQNYLLQYYNDKATSAEADLVSVTPGNTTSEINAALHPGGQLAGTVTDAATKAGVEGIQVCAFESSGEFFDRCTETNSSGEYDVIGLPSGSYTVSFSSSLGEYASQYYNGKSQQLEATPVAVAAGSTTASINAALARAGEISGTVTNAATHAPVGEVQVCALQATSGSFVRCANSNGSGEYRIAPLAAGEYKVEFAVTSSSTTNFATQYYNGKSTFAQADVISLAEGGTATNVDAALHEAGKITGKVTDATTISPVEGITVCAQKPTGEFVGRCGTTNASGEYAVTALNTGEYKVEFFPGSRNYLLQYYNGKATFGEAQLVSVTSGEATSGIDAALQPGGKITGSVTDSAGKAPISGISVCAFPKNGGSGGCTSTNASGEYSLIALPTAEYIVGFSGGGKNYITQYYNGRGSFGEATALSVTAGSTRENINAILELGGEITGTVTAAKTKEALSGIEIEILASNGNFVASAFTNAKGEYTALALPTGEYKVEFFAFGQEYLSQFYSGKKTLAEATFVSATAAGHVTPNVDAALLLAPPTVISPPTIAGNAVEGHILTAAHGSWKNQPEEFTYQWLRCNREGGECASISKATEQTYTTVFADVGHALRVEETAHNEGGASQPSTSDATAPVVVAPPENSKPPSISGTAQQGKTLSDVPGTWTNEPTKFKYQWRRCNNKGEACESIEVSAGSTYVPTSTDVGHTLRLEETAENGAGPGSPATSAATAEVVPPTPVNTGVPTITGTAQQGRPLTDHHGTWEHSPTEFKYQWLQCNKLGEGCLPITGANEQTYVPHPEDVAMTLRVEEFAKNAGGTSEPAVSVATAEVLPAPPVDISPPTISGTAQQGKELAEEHGSWENNPTSYKLEWKRCNKEGEACESIDGAEGQPYTLTATDVGHTIRVAETAKNAGGTSEPATSTPTSVVVPPAPVNKSPPTITGTAKQGDELTAHHGSWDNTPASYEDKWLRCNTKGEACEAIGTTGETYKLVTADVGHTIRVEEIASNEGGPSSPATSKQTDTVANAAPENETPPTITGTPQQGEELTLHHGGWTNEPTGYEDQWLRCNEGGAGCAVIPGAKGQTYVPVKEDVGHTIRVEEKAQNVGGTSTPTESAATSVVVPATPVNISKPTITGEPVQGKTLTEHHGNWENTPTSYKLRWLACDSLGEGCLPIAGAEAETYKPTALDVGHTNRVEEVATNSGGSSEPATSEPTEAIKAAPPVNVSPPTIAGTPETGHALVEQHGTWTNEPSGYEYQWLRCNEPGSECHPIEGATEQGYAPTALDVRRGLVVRETASNAGGAGEPATSIETQPVIPKTTLEASITGGPTGPTNQAGPFSFTATGPGSFECAVDHEAFAPCITPVVLEHLGDGAHTFYVRAINSLGQTEAAAAERQFTLDTVEPTVRITQAPDQPVHSGSLGFAYESSEPGEVECAVDGTEFRSCGGRNWYAEEFSNGEHHFKVRAVDLARNTSPIAEAAFTIVNQPPTGTLHVSQDAGPAALNTVATVEGSDPDNDGLHYELQFGDGESTSGTLPAKAIEHSYGEPGVYEMRLDITDGHEHTITTHTVTVTLDEPVQAKAGEDQTAVAGETVTLDGEDSRPLRGITGYHWTFGDGEEADAGTVQHVYANPGDYKATLTVQGPGEHDSSTATIHVLPKPGGEGYVETVESGGAPLDGAEVLVILGDGTRIRGISGSDGKAHLYGLHDGEYQAYVYKPGYIPTATHALAEAGGGTGTVELKAGDTATAHVTSHPMNLKEIEEAGIDPSDPANRHVYEFNVNINVVPFAPAGGGGGGGGGSGSFGGHIGGAGFVGGPCNAKTLCVWHAGGATIYTTVTYVPGVDAPILSSLVIPFKASWLKEFFAVSMIVDNLAPQPFTLKGGHATISIPSGMSLAPTATPQSITNTLPDIPGEGSATAQWILRGDTEGYYNVAATYAASLEPFGRTLNLSAATTTPIHVWGASAIQLTVEVDKQLKDSYPFHVKVGMKDVADVPVYDPEIELLKRGRHGYIEQPAQQNTYGTREIAPGQTFWSGEFILVPEATGEVDLEHSFIQKVGGDVELHPTLVTHDRKPSLAETPEIKGHRRNNHAITLEWDKVPGATGYEIYRTPDRETDFAGSADPNVVPVEETKAVVTDAPSDPTSYYAVSAIINGRRVMVHPMISSTQVTPGGFPRIQVSDETECGATRTAATVTLEDEDFALKSWTANVGGHNIPQGLLSGKVATEKIQADRQPGQLAPYTMAVESTEPDAARANPGSGGPSVIETGTLGECHAVGLGDSFSSGEGNPLFDTGTAHDDYGTDGENNCHQSEHAYLRDAVMKRKDIIIDAFVACSGAEINNLFAGSANGDQKSLPAQVNAINGSTELVTLSIGGNDLGFSNILKGCIASHVLSKGQGLPCLLAAAPIVDALLPGVKARLKDTYEKLKTALDTKGRSHAPRIIVMGYPEIFPQSEPLIPTATCLALSREDIGWMHDMIAQVNQEFAAVAAQAGVEYIDPNSKNRFEHHDVCNVDGYFNGVHFNPLKDGFDLEESFHPNASGQRAMGEALAEELDNRANPIYTVDQGQQVTTDVVVAAAKTLLSVGITWPGSDVELSLVSPGGTVIDRQTVPTGVAHERGATYESYAIPDAEPGKWTVNLKGLEVATNGEPVTVTTKDLSAEALPPTAIFSSTPEEGAVSLSVHFDGTTSIDRSGQGLTYTWEYGDGAMGTGSALSHRYERTGIYTPSLTVTDSNGLTSHYKGSPIVVTGAPTVSEQPADATVKPGETATFNAKSGGYPTPTVQWQLSERLGPFHDIPGATQGALTLQNVQTTDTGERFRAVFTNRDGTATSSAATLTVTTTRALPRWTGYCKTTKGKRTCGLYPVAFTGSGGSIALRARKHQVVCKKLTSTGEILETSIHATMTLTGCRATATKAPCQSLTTTGEIRLSGTEDRLGYIERKRQFGDELLPGSAALLGPGHHGLLTRFHCGSEPPVQLEGGAIAAIQPVNRAASYYGLTFRASTTVVERGVGTRKHKVTEFVQKPGAFAGGEPVPLVSWIAEETVGTAIEGHEQIRLAHPSKLEG